MAFQNVGSVAPVYIDASPTDQKKITNLGGGTLYYAAASSVSSGSNDGSVAAGASLEISDGKYVIAAAGGTGLHVEDQGDVAVADDLSVTDDLSVAGDLSVGGAFVPANQAASIADASEAHALNATFDDTEAEAALDALGGTVNEIIAALVANGIVAAAE